MDNRTQGSTDPFYKSREWLSVRYRRLAMDRYQCVECGVSVRGKGLSRVDHIQPRKTHPHLSLEIGNLRTLCAACDNKRHREKGYSDREVKPVGFDGAPFGWYQQTSGDEKK